MKEKFYSKRDVLTKIEQENYYQAVTVFETPSEGYDAITFVTSVGGKADDLLLQLAYKANPSSRSIRKGLITSSPEGGMDLSRFSEMHPAHFVVIMRNPMRTYAERKKLSIEDVYKEIREKDTDNKSKKQLSIERDITITKNLQNANLDAAVKLSKRTGAGLSIIYSYIEDEEGLNERQAEFLNQIINQVTSLKGSK